MLYVAEIELKAGLAAIEVGANPASPTSVQNWLNGDMIPNPIQSHLLSANSPFKFDDK